MRNKENRQHLSSERKLAAILFADIVGYTALMQKDEATARQMLDKFHFAINTKVDLHQRQVVNNYGDGCLCTFDSAVAAVQCAKELQQDFQSLPKVPVRIGMHSGDVFFEKDNVYGDSVNIASRIESMGVPGAILFSKKIRDEIKNQPGLKINSLGNFAFKNVEEVMEVFALANEVFVVPKREEMKGKFKIKNNNFRKIIAALIAVILLFYLGYFFISKDDINPVSSTPEAIAIFPFDVKGSPDIQYLGDGMVDLISTQLDEMPGINSIDPNLIFSKIEDKPTLIRNPELAAKFSKTVNAGQFILGNILELDGVLKITASKYNNDGKIINTVSVSGNKEGQLAITIDNLTKQLIAREMESRGQELKSLAAISTGNMQSLKAYLEGEQAYRAGNYKQALDFFQNATKLDSTFALAWMRVIDANSWDIDNPAPADAYENWIKYKHQMPKKWQAYQEAYLHYINGNQKAVDIYNKLIREYGESRAFINGIAEFYFHFNQLYGRSELAAKPYLIRNLELEPNNIETFVHLSDIAVMEADTAALQEMLARTDEHSETYPEIQIKILMLQDSITDEEIKELVNHPHFRREHLFRTYAPVKGKMSDGTFAERILHFFPDKTMSQLLNEVFDKGNQGKEKEYYLAFKELTDWNSPFYIPLDKYFRCLPATFIADPAYLPMSEQYAEFYESVKGKESPWELYAATKYAMALDKEKEAAFYKNKLLEKTKDPEAGEKAKYHLYSLYAFEAKMDGNNELALGWIDSAFQHSTGWWEMQSAVYDKTIMIGNIYAETGQYEKAIPYFENISLDLGAELILGYATYHLTRWYEKIGNKEKALFKCDLFLEKYKNCDEKYRHWLDEVANRKQRLINKIN